MTAPIRNIAPAAVRLDSAFVQRAERIARPIVKTALHGEAEIVGTYDGQNIYRLMSNGQYYALEVGCHETIEEVAEQIDMWRAGFKRC